MANDPRKLRPSEICRLLNSTPLGEVINERQLHRHRTRAGLRIGDAQHVDLLRYVAWLVALRHTPKPAPDGDPYEKMKDRARARNAALALAGRDIGPLPDVVNPDRKARAAASFRDFCDTYFPLTFHLAWSDDHLKVIAKIEQAVLRGGLFALAMPRGSGKTTLAECACLWAILFGHRQFVTLIGASELHAEEMLDSMKSELDGNDLLLQDFPEVVFPIQALDGIANRCAGQLYQGERTHIVWTAKEIVLPTIPESPASAAIIKVAGITGRIRGMKFKRFDGRTVRPSLVVLDDPQTDESARSASQSAERERILAGAVLGLAGPGQKIAGIMPCTVIRPDDMADKILSRDKHPEWNGERTKMLYSFPTDEPKWQRYRELRAESLRAHGDIRLATQYYAAHQSDMDAGARVAWPDRFHPDELSAIQHAMNLKLQDEAAFWAEYQNEPLPEVQPDGDVLTAEQIAAKTNGRARADVPLACQYLTMFIDVQQDLLYGMLVAWEEDFTGYIIDYFSYPDQQRPYFTLRDARYTLGTVSGEAGLEGAIYAGLKSVTDDYLGRLFTRDDRSELRVGKCLIDANWGTSTDVVYQFCRQSPFSGVVMPSHGRFVGAASKPFREYRPAPGERLGLNWFIPNLNGKRAVRHILFDANYWKTFVQTRLKVSLGDPGCLSLFGDRPEQHRLLSEHLTAEYRVRTEGRGRTVDEWRLRPDRADNHWLDCLVGSAVAASLLGSHLPATGAPTRRSDPMQRPSLAELKAGTYRK